MRGAVSGSVVSISNFPASQIISGTVTANPTGTQTIAGTVTANIGSAGRYDNGGDSLRMDLMGVRGQDAALFLREGGGNVPISGTVTIGSALPTGTNRIGVVTIGGGTVTIGAGTAQIGSVTAFVLDLTNATENYDEAINQSVIAIHIKDLAGNVLGTSVSPMLISGTVTLGGSTAQIGSVTASISNSVVTFYPLQGTTVTNSNFTSTTASTTLVSAVAGREVLTVFNEGAGNLHISPGATATTISYQVRLSPGDYWECPAGQLSLAHTAVFSTAGTARVTEVS